MSVIMSDSKTLYKFFEHIYADQLYVDILASGCKLYLGVSKLTVKKDGFLVAEIPHPYGLTTEAILKSYVIKGMADEIAEAIYTQTIAPKGDVTVPMAKQHKETPAPVDGNPVRLHSATEMYQPVIGTSPGSIYKVIGISIEGVKIAAKIKGLKVSIRAEREGVEHFLAGAKVTEDLVGAGLHVADQKTYMSGHFSCSNTTPSKLIGAVIVGCGLSFKTPIPDISKIV